MPVYNLIEYSKKYLKTSATSFWNYYRDKPTNDNEKNHYLKSKSFDYKSSVIDKLGDIDNENKANKENYCTIKTFEQFLEKFRHIII